MKILVITDSYPPHHSGGYELRCKDIIDGLRSKGHDITIITTICPAKKCDIHSNDQEIYRVLHKGIINPVFFRVARDLKDIRLLNEKINKISPDVIFLFHLVNLSNAIIPFLSQQKIPLVYDEGGTGLLHAKRKHVAGLYFGKNNKNSRIIKTIKKTINGLIYYMSNKLLVTDWEWPKDICVYFNSKNGMQYALERGLNDINSRVIHSAVNTSTFQFNFHSFHDKLRIITPGRIHPSKGTLDSVYLVKKLIENEILVNLKIIGMVQDVSYYQAIKTLISEYGLNKYIEFIPMIKHDDLVQYYQESDICFFPSYRRYGLSRIPLEAMACGCIVLTYGNEGSSELITHNDTGFILSDGVDASVVELIKNLVSDPSQSYRIIHGARAQIENNHTMKKYVQVIEELLINCVNEFGRNSNI